MRSLRGVVKPSPNRVPALFLALVLTGCSSVGPNTVERDRFNYNAAIAASWKEQLLVNMVRLRYGEAPVFLDVASVIAQYSLEGEASLGGGLNNSFTGADTVTVGGAARWADRPTITYAPRVGSEFTRSLLTPIPPAAIFSLIQSGWSVEMVFGDTVRSINGIPDKDPVTGRWNPEFSEIIDALDVIQHSGAFGLRTRAETEAMANSLVFRDVKVEPRVEEAIRFLRDKLELDPAIQEYELVFGLIPDEKDEIALLTSSMVEIMQELSSFFEVPEHHVAEGWTAPTRVPSSDHPAGPRVPILVRASDDRPRDAFVAVQNRGWWFSIPENDLESKRLFSFLTVLLRLAESSDVAFGPVVTIGAGG